MSESASNGWGPRLRRLVVLNPKFSRVSAKTQRISVVPMTSVNDISGDLRRLRRDHFRGVEAVTPRFQTGDVIVCDRSHPAWRTGNLRLQGNSRAGMCVRSPTAIVTCCVRNTMVTGS